MFRFLCLLLLAGCDPKALDEDDESWGDADADGGSSDECEGNPSAVLCDGTVAVHCTPGERIDHEEDCYGTGAICVEDQGCTSCGVELTMGGAGSSAPEDALSFVEVQDGVTADTFGWKRFHMRPVTVSMVDSALSEGQVTVELLSSWSMWSTDGGRQTSPLTLNASALPVVLLLTTEMAGKTPLTASHSACPSTQATVTLESGTAQLLAGHPLTKAPFFERTHVFNTDEVIRTAVDPVRHSDRLGAEYAVHIVNRKTPEEWAADPSLVDVSMGTSETGTVNGTNVADNIIDAWTSTMTVDADLDRALDIVFDFNDNLQLDPGDLMQGPGDEQPGILLVGDLSTAGPYTSEMTDYGASYWLTQRVYFPSNIRSLDPAPLVVISHGNGHDYLWYDYLGYHLSSHGFVVMTHRNETGPGISTAAQTTLTNTDWFLGNLDIIGTGQLDGFIDSSRIVWIGHSRGGEGVAYAYDRIVDGAYVPENYSASDIQLISSIAPTVYYSVTDTNPHDAPYHLFAGAADGDVTGGPDSAQVQFFRIVSVSEAPKQSTYLQGVGHNEFNCCGFADATGPSLIGREATMLVAKAYYLALLRAYTEGKSQYLDYFKRRADVFRPANMSSAVVLSNTYKPGPGAGALVIDDFQTSTGLADSAIRGSVAFTVSNPHEALLNDSNTTFNWTETDPMNGMTQASDAHDTDRGLVFDWDGPATVSWSIPASSSDFRAWTWLTFRAAQGTRHPNTVAAAGQLSFTVTLVDGAGVESGIHFGEMGQLEAPYARNGKGPGSGWANEFSTIRLRLLDFRSNGGGLDLSNIATLRFDFGGFDGTTQGRIGLDDILLEH